MPGKPNAYNHITYRACGCDLRAYDHKSFRGRSLLIRQQNANFRNDYYDDRMESLKIYRSCQWLLYQHINFLGQSYVLNPGSYHTAGNWGGSGNRISSARALPPRGKKSDSPLSTYQVCRTYAGIVWLPQQFTSY